MADRAQPPLDLSLDQNTPPRKKFPDSKRRAMFDEDKFLIRMPVWIKDAMHEAARAEGLSMNAWCQRVIAEATKKSAKDGWRTIPVDDPPRNAPPSTPVVQPVQPGVIVPSIQPSIWPTTSPTTTPYVVNTTNTSTNEPASGGTINVTSIKDGRTVTVSADWNPPDEDIPELT